MVYSTCSINKEENTKVIEKFLKKNQKNCKIIDYPKNLPGYSKSSQFGQIDILEERENNFDPMFIAIIEKNELS